MATWIVTREGGDAEQTVLALQARGLRARALPCIEREVLPWPDTLTPEHDGAGTLMLCTSPFAARLLIERWPLLRTAAGAAPLSCAATAPTTARLLDDAGVPVSTRVSGGVVALAEAVASAVHAGPRPCVLYPTSDAGEEREEHAAALAALAKVADVRTAVAYATRAPAGLDDALRDLERDAALLLFSPSAVSSWVAAAARTGVACPATVVCVGASTARAFEGVAHRKATLVPRGADLTDFLCTLVSSPTEAPP